LIVKLHEIRCTKCNRLLAKVNITGTIEVKCDKCNKINLIKY